MSVSSATHHSKHFTVPYQHIHTFIDTHTLSLIGIQYLAQGHAAIQTGREIKRRTSWVLDDLPLQLSLEIFILFYFIRVNGEQGCQYIILP